MMVPDDLEEDQAEGSDDLGELRKVVQINSNQGRAAHAVKRILILHRWV